MRWFLITTIAEALAGGLAKSFFPILLVSSFSASAATLGIINAITLSVFILASIPAGALVDRTGKPELITALSTSARMLGALAAVLIWLSGALPDQVGIAVILLLSLVMSFGDVGFAAGRSVLVPRLVPKDSVRSLYGHIQALAQSGFVAAPLLLSALLIRTETSLIWLAVAALFLFSLASQAGFWGVDVEAPVSGRASRPRHKITAGISYIRRTPALCHLSLANGLFNASNGVTNIVLPIMTMTVFGLHPTTYALAGSVGAVAGILGSSIASRATQRLGIFRVRVVALVGSGIAVIILLLGLATAGDHPGLAAAVIYVCQALLGCTAATTQISGADLLPKLTPATMLGAAAGAQRTFVMGTTPIAMLLTGLATSWVSLEITLIAWLILLAATVVPTVRLAQAADAAQ